MARKLAVFAGCLIGALSPVAVPAQDAPLGLSLVQDEDGTRSLDLRLVTPADGHLLLLHIVRGDVRVMFPGKPASSSALPAGEYNLDRLSAEKPWAFGRGGTIVAAWSAAPIRTGELVRYGHWAVSDLDKGSFRSNPTVAGLELARSLGGDPSTLSVSVEYDGPALTATRSAYASGQTYRGDTLDLAVKVWRNYARIQGICPSGTRDVTGAREFCTAPSAPRRAVRQIVIPESEPPAPPARVLYAPPPPVMTPVSAPRPATPTATGSSRIKQ
jgi:hypothetical protein